MFRGIRQICLNKLCGLEIGKAGKTMFTGKAFSARMSHRCINSFALLGRSVTSDTTRTNFSQFRQHHYICRRLLSTSPTLQQKLQSESQEDSDSAFANKIIEKFGSRLEGWDPRETNNGLPTVVYTGFLKDQIRMLKIFSFTTTAMGLAFQAVLIEQLKDSSLLAKSAVFGVIGFFVFVSPVLIHLLAKRYVTELSYDPKSDTYTSATYSFFLRRNELKFKVEDVIVPTVPGLLTTVLVKSGDKTLPLFLADVCFKDLRHYGRLMGFDKPIDLGIDPNDIETEASANEQYSSLKSNQKPPQKS